MPDLFRLNQNDALVRKYLTQAERAQIQNAHTTDAWDFEFHGGHEQGTPFYIRPKGCTVKQNLAKFDTHTLTGSKLQYNANNIRNKEDIVDPMQRRDREQMYLVVSTNWDRLCTLALRFKSGDERGAAEQARLAQPVQAAPTTKRCPNPNPAPNGCQGQVPIVRSGKAMCPVCFQYS